jgi:hypothetical protein
MRRVKVVGLLTIWALCAVSAAAALAMVSNVAAHPLAEAGAWKLGLAYAVPYLLLAALAWAGRRGIAALTVLVFLTALAALVGTSGCYQIRRYGLVLMGGWGRKVMSCGPPAGLFAAGRCTGLLLGGGGLAALAVGRLPGRHAQPRPWIGCSRGGSGGL